MKKFHWTAVPNITHKIYRLLNMKIGKKLIFPNIICIWSIVAILLNNKIVIQFANEVVECRTRPIVYFTHRQWHINDIFVVNNFRHFFVIWLLLF